MGSVYEFNAEAGVYCRTGYSGIGYADGVEAELHAIVSQVHDRSLLSGEFLPHMKNWPAEYHFSRKRHLVLRPFAIQPGDRVLELGCGCGAITRYLAELGAEVTAVEGEISRARVAAKRCEGMANVRFIVDDFLSLELEERFDWVLMIGVFEYSQKFGRTENRQEEYLNVVKRHLAPDGTTIVAIENKLGLKYLNGAGEDHNGALYYAPQDLYANRDVTTWGRTELLQKFATAGFESADFFSAFPDYKLPKVLFSERIDSEKDFRAEELVHYCASLDYRGKNTRNFDESLVLGTLRKNGLMTDFGNSFVVALRQGVGALPPSDPSVLAYYYSVDRHPHYCTQTRFVRNVGNSCIEVEKSLLDSPSERHNKITLTDGSARQWSVTHVPGTSVGQYFSGVLMGYELSKSVMRRDAEAVKRLLSQWGELLRSEYKFYCAITGQPISVAELKDRPLRDVLIDGAAIDSGPQNIILSDKPTVFDTEWVSDQPVPLGWVLQRNSWFVSRLRHLGDRALGVEDIVGYVCTELGLKASANDLKTAQEQERSFQRSVAHVEPSSNIRLNFAKQ